MVDTWYWQLFVKSGEFVINHEKRRNVRCKMGDFAPPFRLGALDADDSEKVGN